MLSTVAMMVKATENRLPSVSLTFFPITFPAEKCLLADPQQVYTLMTLSVHLPLYRYLSAEKKFLLQFLSYQ